MNLLILIIVFFLALIVFIVLSAKKTHWMNLVGAFFVFLGATFYLVMAGMVVETRTNWLEVYENNLKKNETMVASTELVLTGKKNFEWPLTSLKGIETEAEKKVYGRGRVWRECIPEAFVPGANPADIKTGSLTLNVPPNSPAFRAKSDPNVPDSENASGTNLVFVFLEEIDPDQPNIEVPDPNNPGRSISQRNYRISRYIGSFFATEPADDNSTVKLIPSLVLPNPENLAELKQRDPTYRTSRELLTTPPTAETRWALYDVLPNDGYDVFREAISATNPEQEVSLDDLRTALTTKYLTIEKMRMQNEPQKYQSIIDSIVYTNQDEKVYSENANFKPEDDEIWYEIEFKDKPRGQFKVDFSAGAGGPGQGDISLQGQAFDRDGLAQVQPLKLGGDVQFDKDDTVVLDTNAWVKNPHPILKEMKEKDPKTAVENRKFYRRKLIDFDYVFRSLVAANTRVRAERDDAQATYTQLDGISKELETHQTRRTKIQNELDQDVRGYKTDQTDLTNYQMKLASQLEEERKLVDKYYRLTKELADKKAELVTKLEKLIDEKTQKAVESSDAQ